MVDIRRRQLLAATGVGLGIATAGCSGASEQRTVTVYLQQTQDAQTQLQQKSQQLRQQLQSGNITRQEASSQYTELQSQLNSELNETAKTEARSLSLTVMDSYSAQGNPPVLLVSGPSNALIDYVQLDIVTGISSAKRFREIKQQQGQQTQPNGTSEQTG